jgi:hypothetical protein
MYYLVNKVLINKEEIEENQISTECLNIFTKNHEVISFINELKYISIFNEDIILSNDIKKTTLTNKDIDGYHIVIDNKNSKKFNIYLKKSSLLKGYIYNSIDITIKYIGYIEILTIKPNSNNHLNLNKLIQPKKTPLHNNNNNNLDTHTNNNNNKKQKLDSNYKHVYLELNDKLIEELKIKLQKLSIK